jgi:hypothetical protein
VAGRSGVQISAGTKDILFSRSAIFAPGPTQRSIHRVKLNVKVKQFVYRPGQACNAPGGLGSEILR